MIKKLSLFACAIASALPVASTLSHAAAQAPGVSLGGFARFQSFVARNGKTPNLPSNPGSNPSLGKDSYTFTEAGEIQFTVAGETSGGTAYDYIITMSGDNGQNTSNFKPTINENRIQLSDSWGTVQLGDADGVQDFFTVGVLNVLGATGGLGGDYNQVFTVPSEVYAGTLMKGDTATATKASYYSPRVNGFQFGVSFTPRSDQKGSNAESDRSATGVYSTGNLAVGINFARAWNSVGLSMSLAGLAGNGKLAAGNTNTAFSTNRQINPVRAWQAGILLTMSEWMLGASYVDNGKSLVPNVYSQQGADAGKAIAVAAGYNFGSTKVAAGYQNTQAGIQSGTNKAKANVYSLTADHTLAPGLGIYAEADYAKMTTNTTAVNRSEVTNGKAGKNSNRGSVFITGVKISF